MEHYLDVCRATNGEHIKILRDMHENAKSDEHFTAKPISISLLSKMLLRLETMSNIFDQPVFVDPWK